MIWYVSLHARHIISQYNIMCCHIFYLRCAVWTLFCLWGSTALLFWWGYSENILQRDKVKNCRIHLYETENRMVKAWWGEMGHCYFLDVKCVLGEWILSRDVKPLLEVNDTVLCSLALLSVYSSRVLCYCIKKTIPERYRTFRTDDDCAGITLMWLAPARHGWWWADCILPGIFCFTERCWHPRFEKV